MGVLLEESELPSDNFIYFFKVYETVMMLITLITLIPKIFIVNKYIMKGNEVSVSLVKKITVCPKQG